MPGGYKNIKPEDGAKTRFKKGQSGNLAGKPPKLPDLNILLADVLGEEKNGITAAQQILNALRVKANKGDIRAAEVLLNRGYGLPKQSMEVSGNLGVTWIEQKTYEAKPEADTGA